MKNEIAQGEIYSVEKIKMPVLVVSKNFFNKSEQIIACPIMDKASKDPLHIPIQTKDLKGVVLCEQLRLLDLRVRGYSKLSELKQDEVMNISDAIQSIFDYYPFGR